jgi:hypothetical protein
MLKLGRGVQVRQAAPQALLLGADARGAAVYAVSCGQALVYPRGLKNTRPTELQALPAGRAFSAGGLRREFGSAVEVAAGAEALELLELDPAAAEFLLQKSIRPEARRK